MKSKIITKLSQVPETIETENQTKVKLKIEY
jgi:hypothetical protein